VNGFSRLNNRIRVGVKEGSLTVTVSQSTTGQGMTAMETVVKLANGKTVEEKVLVCFTLNNASNIGEYVK
jgi:ABC-type sugar transport system substrate-binding protein